MGPCLRFQERNSISGQQVLPGSRARRFSVLTAEGVGWSVSLQVACWRFWVPEGACRARVSRAVNGAVLEVSGKKQHLGLGGFAREQDPDIFSFDGGRRSLSSWILSHLSEFLDV